MAIFSSSKKKKADQNPPAGAGAIAPGGSGSPPLNVPRSQSGSFGNSSGFQAQHALSGHQPNASLTRDPSAELATPPSSPPQAHGGPGPQGQGPSPLYPWSLRRLSLLPSALLPPAEPGYPGAVPQTIAGPLSAPPFPRYGHSVNPVASAATGDLYVFGGLVQNAVKNDLYVLSCIPQPGPDAQAGAKSGALSVGLVETRGEVPGPRVGHASVGVGNVLIVWGGDTKSHPEDIQDDSLYLLNLSKHRCSSLASLDSVRALIVVCVCWQALRSGLG